ncbi:hypothetical protein HELRODRAFT_177296 [Helobdella robusta]|uniref:Uncharacterized protein n=1 Tax=Helobdella robusta TaxID=6412 RepID=T1FBG9_HELRO|nr:hypothetical protein HELRODRAFT_177296 [Helobdella robusta]ESN98063.1 hypothetical protein HELRODRAFT_177296 [Helobdella robusta]
MKKKMKKKMMRRKIMKMMTLMKKTMKKKMMTSMKMMTLMKKKMIKMKKKKPSAFVHGWQDTSIKYSNWKPTYPVYENVGTCMAELCDERYCLCTKNATPFKVYNGIADGNSECVKTRSDGWQLEVYDEAVSVLVVEGDVGNQSVAENLLGFVERTSNGRGQWVLRSALNFASDGEIVREVGREFQRKGPEKAKADLAKECLTRVKKKREKEDDRKPGRLGSINISDKYLGNNLD